MTTTTHIDELWQVVETDDEPARLLVLADAMEEDGDPLADGIRWLGENGKRPRDDGEHPVTDWGGRTWWWGHPEWEDRHALPLDVDDLMAPNKSHHEYAFFTATDAYLEAAQAVIDAGLARDLLARTDPARRPHVPRLAGRTAVDDGRADFGRRQPR